MSNVELAQVAEEAHMEEVQAWLHNLTELDQFFAVVIVVAILIAVFVGPSLMDDLRGEDLRKELRDGPRHGRRGQQ